MAFNDVKLYYLSIFLLLIQIGFNVRKLIYKYETSKRATAHSNSGWIRWEKTSLIVESYQVYHELNVAAMRGFWNYDVADYRRVWGLVIRAFTRKGYIECRMDEMEASHPNRETRGRVWSMSTPAFKCNCTWVGNRKWPLGR